MNEKGGPYHEHIKCCWLKRIALHGHPIATKASKALTEETLNKYLSKK